MLSHYKKIGYNINVVQRTACLVVNPITVATLFSSLIARQSVGLQTLCRFRLKELSIDEMEEAWCFGCCQAHRGLHVPVRFLLLRYSVLCTVEFLSLLHLLFTS